MVKPDGSNEEQIKNGIYIPETARELPQEATVVAVGPDVEEAKVKLEEGDRVLMPKYGGSGVKIDEEHFEILSYDDILAVVRDEA